LLFPLREIAQLVVLVPKLLDGPIEERV